MCVVCVIWGRSIKHLCLHAWGHMRCDCVIGDATASHAQNLLGLEAAYEFNSVDKGQGDFFYPL